MDVGLAARYGHEAAEQAPLAPVHLVVVDGEERQPLLVGRERFRVAHELPTTPRALLDKGVLVIGGRIVDVERLVRLGAQTPDDETYAFPVAGVNHAVGQSGGAAHQAAGDEIVALMGRLVQLEIERFESGLRQLRCGRKLPCDIERLPGRKGAPLFA
jgi:hypothetical protein